MSMDQASPQAILDLLHQRISYPKLTEPAPKGEELKAILGTAMRAPDHKVLRPARYLLIEGDDRKRLGEVFAKAALSADPNCPEAKLEKSRNKPLRAPLVLVAVSRNEVHPKVPAFEQEQSVAAGLMLILVALQACGYGGIWRTGDMAVNQEVKDALGIAAHESLVGFLYIGTPEGEPKRIPEYNFDDFFSTWQGV